MLEGVQYLNQTNTPYHTLNYNTLLKHKHKTLKELFQFLGGGNLRHAKSAVQKNLYRTKCPRIKYTILPETQQIFALQDLHQFNTEKYRYKVERHPVARKILNNFRIQERRWVVV